MANFMLPNYLTELRMIFGEDPSTYRVASVALEPVILTYNGFYSLDGYQANYPLPYKYVFRKIIAAELEKDEKLKASYDAWGGRLYIFSSEIPLTRQGFVMKDQIDDLQMNAEAFKAMGGKYIFSALPIMNHAEIGLEFIKKYSDESSPWLIHLYRAI